MKLNATVQTRQGRYTLGASAPVRDDLGAPVGRAGIGVDKTGAASLVFETGQQQSGVPVAALVAALTDDKVIPAAALVGAFQEAGRLPALVAAIEKAGK